MTPGALLGPEQSASTIVGGRTIPLPSGAWQSVIRGHHNGDPQVDWQMLARVRNNRVIGLVVAFVVPSPTISVSKLPFGQACGGTRTLQARTVADTGDARECWGIVAPAVPSRDWSRPRTELVYTRSLDGFHQAGIALPEAMIGAVWNYVDLTNWAIVQYFFDPGANPPAPVQASAWGRGRVASNAAASALVKRVADWAERYTKLLQQGLHGGLSDATINSAMRSNDPA